MQLRNRVGTIGQNEIIRRRGFALIELIVVMVILALLCAFLAAGSAGAKERTRRTACLNNERQLIISLQIYAGDNNDSLPNGGREASLEMHTSLLPRGSFTNILRLVKSVRAMDCPNLNPRFEKTVPGMFIPDWRTHGEGIAIGYHYLAGHKDTPWVRKNSATTNRWFSPQKTSDAPTAVLLADLNAYGNGMTLIPHRARGSLILERKANEIPAPPLLAPKSGGAAGGNVGHLDGSVEWKAISQMHDFLAARFGEYYGNW